MSLKNARCRRAAVPLALAFVTLVWPLMSELSSAAEVVQELPLNTKIISATIYAWQTQVIRRGELELSRGSFRLVCGDLPKAFTETSLSIVGKGLPGARIVGIDLRRTERVDTDSPRYQELDLELKKLKAALERLQVRRRAIEGRRNFTASISHLSADQARERVAEGTFTTAEWRTLLAFLEEEEIETGERAEDLETETQELRERIGWIGGEMAAMRVTGGSGREVVIDCEVTTPGAMSLELSYIVPGASWHPEYTVRYIEQDSEAELTYSARVAQATGEDWKDVSVVLSTAMPHVGAAPPELPPQYLGVTTGTIRGMVTDAATGAPLPFAGVAVEGTRFSATATSQGAYVITDVPAGIHTLNVSHTGYESEQRPGVRVVAGRSVRVDFWLRGAALTADAVKVRPINTVQEAIATQPGVVLHEGEIHVRGGRASEVKSYVQEPPPVPYVEAELVGTEFATNLVIPKPVDLETGGEPRRSLVVRASLPGRFLLEAVPRLSDHVFLRGSFVNSLEVPLLSGPAEVYVETTPRGSVTAVSNFVGQDRLTDVAQGEEFTMYLGVDQSVKADFELKTREVLSRGKSSTVKVRYVYAITIESFKREAAEVRVIDRVPVSAMKDIKVGAIEVAPPPARQGEDGLLEWQLTLEPGERRELYEQYEVEYPSDMAPGDLGLDE